mgnify:CR=1 FL=1
MDDKRRTAGNDEDIDLSGMINEYSQDNELRKKIEELKKQKEEEKRMYASRQQETSQGSIFDNISEFPAVVKETGGRNNNRLAVFLYHKYLVINQVVCLICV